MQQQTAKIPKSLKQSLPLAYWIILYLESSFLKSGGFWLLKTFWPHSPNSEACYWTQRDRGPHVWVSPRWPQIGLTWDWTHLEEMRLASSQNLPHSGDHLAVTLAPKDNWFCSPCPVLSRKFSSPSITAEM